MHYFEYKGKHLFCEERELSPIVEKFKTPLYVYSKRTYLEHFYKIQNAFSKINPLICYSVKANSNLTILKTLVEQGAGLDIVSGGELYRAKKVACPGSRIVYASVGKTEDEINEAIKYGILLFNAESIAELERINKAAGLLGKKAGVALRVNPEVRLKTHKYITTGRKDTKFGIDMETVRGIFLKRARFKNLKINGIHIHIGSQITQSRPFIKAIKKMKVLIADGQRKGIDWEYFNIGGGLGIVYDEEKPQTAADFAVKVMPLLEEVSLKVILEPGRFIIGNAGALITKVLYVKDTPAKRFIIVDAGMNDLLRPSLYGAYHKIIPLDRGQKTAISCQLSEDRGQKTEGRGQRKVDVVGPICESGDFLGKDRCLDAKEGDYLAVLGAGAYGFSMSSNYNSRPRPAEVLVDGSKVYCIRERENYRDLIKAEQKKL